ncbi:hypothetical protein DYB38_001665 [Aphanomyces astaci]|uniref:Deacetylase sirtuin-type domain-containing protein n=1 Tax=Aphanomyces astaci TaxID=112090 RepID=A0A397DJ67_APHAT|nr:hypothetical protein DYB38_001665 [Aphanomyces astaci]
MMQHGACRRSRRLLSSYVPAHGKPRTLELQLLQELLAKSKKVVVLTGAGISTESGIPDYRSEGVGLYARANHRPIQHMDFMTSAAVDTMPPKESVHDKSWLRFIGLTTTMHRDVTLVTQNVDRLHTKAGSRDVIELHGSSEEVRCMQPGCAAPPIDRDTFQSILSKLNPIYQDLVFQYINIQHENEVDNNHTNEDRMRPDADMFLSPELERAFDVAVCPYCGHAMYKPNIVFFGDSVPTPKIYDAVKQSDAMLVLGSSLHVFSGYRFARRAAEWKVPLAIVNIGPTRADPIATLKLDAKCSTVLTHLFPLTNM